MRKIIKGDTVIVIAGKDKGKKSKVIKVIGDKVIVDGVNVVKKHQKPNPLKNIEGGILTKNNPISISNVAILNPETQKADRVGFKFIDDGLEGSVGSKKVKIRFFKSNGARIGD